MPGMITAAFVGAVLFEFEFVCKFETNFYLLVF